MSRVRLLGVLAAVAAVGVTAVPATASAAPVITFSGSTSVAPPAGMKSSPVNASGAIAKHSGVGV